MRIFGLLDCNSFYASCEKVFHPRLADRAVVVLSSNDGNVIARSQEAKALGIPMGEAFYKVRHLVERGELAVFSSNFALYGDMSRRVMTLLHQWTPDVEIYSIDEAFLDLSGVRNATSDRFLQDVCRTVRRATGIPVCLGIGPTKTLAKVANRIAKSSGHGICSLVDPAVREELLARFPIDDVWGVGRELNGKFRRLGLQTALQLSRVDPFWMRNNFSIVQERMVRELSGEQCMDLEDAPPPKQTIQTSRSFGARLSSLEELTGPVATFTARAAEKLRTQGSVTSAVQVYINTNRFRTSDPQYSGGISQVLDSPTSDTIALTRAAMTALRQIFRDGYRYQKAGVMLLDIQSAKSVAKQQYLLDFKRPKPENDRLMKTIDAINTSMGQGAITLGTTLSGQEDGANDWTPQSNYISPPFTTSWDALPIAHTG